jgi:CheY-like chemotaxis protein
LFSNPETREQNFMANESILVVDDQIMNLKLLKLLLELEGYRVETAGNAEETFRALQSFRPRLILMDLRLPGLDGIELTKKIKADPQTKDIPILLVTSYIQPGEEERALEAGCDGYFSKPIDTQKLPALIARHLGEDNPRKEKS